MARSLPIEREESTAQRRERTAIQVIDRLMNLLDALAKQSGAVSLKELAQATRLHPSTAHRILNDMVVGRFVDRGDQPGTYRLGMRLLELGNMVKARLSVREAAVEPMRDLHRKTGQTVNLSVRQGDEIVYVERSYSESLIRARGFAKDNEELELGVRCIAAAIRDDSGHVVAGLSVSAPADRLQEAWIEELVGTAGKISAGLGHQAASPS